MKLLEVALWACGTALVVFYAGVQGWGEWARQHAVDTFIEAQQPEQAPRPGELLPARGDELREVMPAAPALPPLPAHGAVIAVLRIPAIGLEGPVSYGTGPLALGRGADLLDGTAAAGRSCCWQVLG